MTDQMTHAEAVSVIAEKVAEIERLQTELAELRKAQGEPAAWVSILGAYAHIQWGSRADDNIHTIPLYTSAPTIPEGYVLVPDLLTEKMLDAWTNTATFDRAYVAMIAAAPKPTKDAA